MAGSYQHCVQTDGKLRSAEDLAEMLDTPGDVAEAIEEMYGMIWYLAGGNSDLVSEAATLYHEGLELSPGTADEE